MDEIITGAARDDYKQAYVGEIGDLIPARYQLQQFQHVHTRCCIEQADDTLSAMPALRVLTFL